MQGRLIRIIPHSDERRKKRQKVTTPEERERVQSAGDGAESSTVCSDCLKKRDRDPGDPSLHRVSPKVSAIRTAAERSISASLSKEEEGGE